MNVFFSTLIRVNLLALMQTIPKYAFKCYSNPKCTPFLQYIPFSLTISRSVSLTLSLSLSISLYDIYVCACTEIRNIFRQLKTLKNLTKTLWNNWKQKWEKKKKNKNKENNAMPQNVYLAHCIWGCLSN